MIFKAVCKIKVPWMPQEEPLFITEIVAPTLDDASGFFVCEYGKEKYDSLFGGNPCEVYFC